MQPRSIAVLLGLALSPAWASEPEDLAGALHRLAPESDPRVLALAL